jgi:hypothetical protein
MKLLFEKIKVVVLNSIPLAILAIGMPFFKAQASIKIENPLAASKFGGKEGVASSIIETLMNFVAGIAIIMLIISGILYIFSQGNENRTGIAKKILSGAVIGLAVVLGAKTFLKEIYIIFHKTAPDAGINAAQSAFQIVERILSLLLSITGMVGIISFIWGALIYFTSAGNEDRAAKGKKQIIYSVLGLVIAIGALVIVKQINSLLQ